MASNQTPNLKLSQWEADDEVLRADFNADNAKIDAGVAAAQAAAVQAKSAADAAQAAADAGYAPGREPFTAGSYTGDGTESQTIHLGFAPLAVLVIPPSGQTYYRLSTSSYSYGGLAVRGQGALSCGLEITDNGFIVRSNGSYMRSNDKNDTYLYLAFR